MSADKQDDKVQGLSKAEQEAVDGVNLAGDADEQGAKITARQSAQSKDSGQSNQSAQPGQRARRGTKGRTPDSEVTTTAVDEQGTEAAHDKKGPYSPAQHDDDGWGGLPVQMRG